MHPTSADVGLRGGGYARAFLNTVLLCFSTALFTLLIGYPLAYAMVRHPSARMRSALLLVSLTPLFLGEIVRTYSWIIVLGNRGFINGMLMQADLIDRPISFMFTLGGAWSRWSISPCPSSW